jgi:caa(3)-type oxidase subunit IV
MTRSTAKTRVEAHERRTARALLAAWWSNLTVWVALLVLLFASLGLAYLPLGVWNFPVGVAIALIKAGLVAFVFMQLDRASALVRLTAAAAFLFVAVMFAFTLSDLFTRQ